jgi:hypothetical protein
MQVVCITGRERHRAAHSASPVHRRHERALGSMAFLMTTPTWLRVPADTTEVQKVIIARELLGDL